MQQESTKGNCSTDSEYEFTWEVSRKSDVKLHDFKMTRGMKARKRKLEAKKKQSAAAAVEYCLFAH